MDLSQEEYESYENGESYQESGEYQGEGAEYEGGYEEYEAGYEYYEGEELPELSEEEIWEIQNFSATTVQKFVRYYLGQKYFKDLYSKRRWTLVKADIITEHATKGRAKGPGSRRPPTRGKKVVGLTEPTYNHNHNSPSESNDEEEGRQTITKSSSATMGGMGDIDLSAVKLKKTPVLSRKNAPKETNDDFSLPDPSPEINTTNHNNSPSASRGRVVRPISVVGLSPIALKTTSSPNTPSSLSNIKPIETSSLSPLPPPKPTISPIPPPTPPHPSTLNSSNPPPPSPSPSFPAPFSSPLPPPNPSLNAQLPPPSFNNPLPPPTFNASSTKSLPAVNRRDVKSMAPTSAASIKANFPPPPPSFASSSNFPPPPPSFASSSSFPPPPPSNSNNNNNNSNNNLNDSSDNIDINNQAIKSNSNYIPPPVVIEKPDKKELHRRKVVKNVLSNFLTKRPARETVIEKGILKGDDTPELQRRGTVSSLNSNSGSNSNITIPTFEEHSSPTGGKVCTNSRCQKKLKSSKNQCRMCQRLFCKNCMNKKAKLPELKINKAVSICDTCFHLKRAIAFEKEKSLNKSDEGAAQ